MAMAAGKSKGSMADINMTPMIDVLLVLLVIFIIAQPMLQRSIDIQLPMEKKSQAAASDAPVIVLEMRPGAYYLDTQTVQPSNLRARLLEVYSNRPDKVLFVKVEGPVKYGEVITAMDIARGAGVEVLGAVLPPLEAAPAP
jgi:biopolymer transport protein ExbD